MGHLPGGGRRAQEEAVIIRADSRLYRQQEDVVAEQAGDRPDRDRPEVVDALNSNPAAHPQSPSIRNRSNRRESFIRRWLDEAEDATGIPRFARECKIKLKLRIQSNLDLRTR